MNKKMLMSGLVAVFLFFGTGCGEFGDTNIDPNKPVSVAPSTLLTASMRAMSDAIGSDLGTLYSQMISETQYTDDSRYGTINYNFSYWYTSPLADLQQIITLNTDEATKADALQSGSHANQIAVARIMKAYFFHFITDRWGAVPYSQALQGSANFKPVYDSQEAIYTDLLKELKEANAQMDSGPGVGGDILFGGNMLEWQKFANSLRGIIAMRMSKVDSDRARAEFASAMSDGFITSDVMYPYLAETNNQNPWFGRFVTRTDYAISLPLTDYMKAADDPRLAHYADLAPASGTIEGMPYGDEDAGDIPNDVISFPNNTFVRGQSAPLGIVTRAQMMFSRAEAAARGWTSEDAETLYKNAIQASMEQWAAFDQDAYDAFIANADVAWDASKALELIGTQKWVALYMQGYEGWNEWKRTGWPALVAPPNPIHTNGTIPRRQGYPTSERDLNGDNYNAAVDTYLGGVDDLEGRMWWDAQ